MRAGLVIAIVMGCAAPHRTAPLDADSDASADASAAGDGSLRTTTAVIVDSTRVAWSRSDVTCPLEGSSSCEARETTLFVADLAIGVPEPLVQTRHGIEIVGDENELFYINRDEDLGQFVVRIRPTTTPSYPVAMSIPRASVRGPFVDATYVYWNEVGINSDPPLRLRRAARAGDGSDVVTIPGTSGGMIFAGYFWSGGCDNSGCVLTRTPLSGGTAEQVSNAGGGVLAADNDALILAQPLAPSSSQERIVAVSADGTMQPLTGYMPRYEGPCGHLVLAGAEMFWSTCAGIVYRLPRTGGTPTVVAGIQTLGPFAVTADSILYDFDATGYKIAPR